MQFRFIFCAVRMETRRQKAASYFFRLILQKRKDLFLLWMYTNKIKLQNYNSDYHD